MRRSCTLKQAALAGLLALAFLVFGGGRQASAAVIDCTNGSPGPNMTIVIYNNAANFNIYPVLFAGTASATDQWMQGCFRIPFNQIADNPYPRTSQYRMYVNCCAPGENGIPPGGSVTITLPFYSPLVTTINPKGATTAQFIDWWQGGGINVYQTNTSTIPAIPPPSLQRHWNDDQTNNRAVTPNRNPPTCGTGCNLHFFVSPASIENWEPQQLIEYTLGAAGEDAQRTDPNQPQFLWVPNNVDYDVSNVNYAYMPAAIEPYGNSLIGTCCSIGWVGSDARIGTVNLAIDNWRSSSLGMGWPLYVDQSSTTNPKATVRRKVPSALEIFLNTAAFNNTNNYSPAPSQSPPFIRMRALFDDCASRIAGYTICGRIRDVATLFGKNYDNWVNVYNTNQKKWTGTDTKNGEWNCTAAPPHLGTPPDAQELLAHLYGWGQFNTNCAATANLLADTPGYTDPTTTPNYAQVKEEYDQLQYWANVLAGDYGQWTDSTKPNYGQFDPYVALVHGKDYMNAPFTYAYSVDDAVGNMQTDGTGLVIGVGGVENLPDPAHPNPAHVTPEVLFTFGYKSVYTTGVSAGLTITFDKYGRCITAPDTDTISFFTTFVVPEGVNGQPNSVVNCQVTFVDNKNRSYTFKLKGFPADFPTPVQGQQPNWPSAQQISQINQQFIDCSGNANQDVLLSWCQNIYTKQQKDLSNPHLPTRYYVIMGAPPPCDRNPQACGIKPPLFSPPVK